MDARGKTLKRVREPDVVIDCEPLECLCGKPQWTEEVEIAEARQVFDLPEPQLEVSEYRRIRRVCRCGRIALGEFPEKVALAGAIWQKSAGIGGTFECSGRFTISENRTAVCRPLRL